MALQPLADRLVWHLLQGNTLHADETPVPQLDPGKGRTKKAYLWVYRSNDLQANPRFVVFDYQKGRGGEHAQQFLGNWQGHLMVDDYAGYKALFTADRKGKDKEALVACIELMCFAHARRKFFGLYQANQSSMAKEALERIALLYEVEDDGKTLNEKDRQQLREDKSLTVLEDLHTWLQDTLVRTAPGGSSAKALNYAWNRWPALIRYAETGHLPIDNNAIENCIRSIAIGRKNWLFAGSERAGKRAAAIQSLLGTAKLNGLDSVAWLKGALEKMPTWPNSRIDELTPFTPEYIEMIKQNKLDMSMRSG